MNGAESGGEVSEVALIADELSRAVELTLNPSVAQESRLQAYNACESFKENSPWCAQAGLLLASGNQYSAVVKHFGLQLMEHTVKYRWTQISQGEKIFIKENAMKLLYMGGWETGHLNDALARVIVEMVKREWPQQWPTLLAELSDACARGHVHTQIVLHIFLRLVEDVATLQTLEQNQRRKDIYQALTSNMAEIFGFFMRLIELHVQEFREKTAAGDYPAAASNERVVQVVLLTLSGFVEWVSTSHIVMNNGRLLQILCILLQDDAFRLPAADCLLQIVNRKGSTKEKKPLMILFSEDAISCIHRAAVACMNSVDERQYLFLKRLTQVVGGLGVLLTSMWSCVSGGVEGWLGALVDTLTTLTAHPSLTVSHLANVVWRDAYRHEHLNKHTLLLDAVPRWLIHTAPKLLKVNYPSSRVSGAYEAVTFACMDYDSEQEFNAFFSRFRTELLDSYRHCMSCAPLVTWSYVEQWIQSVLDKADTHPETVDVTDHVYHEWEALSMMMEVVMSRVLTVSVRPPTPAGLHLLRRCVLTAPASPLLLSFLLSFISALFVFLSCAYSQLAGPAVGSAGAELLPRVIDKIYACVVYKVQTERSRHARNVRRHAANLLVKLATKYPLLLLGVYSHMSSLTSAAVATPALAVQETVTLQEALLLVSNHFCCYDRQAALVTQMVGSVLSKWSSVSSSLSTPEGVCRVMGLCDPPVAGGEDPAAPRRRDIQHALVLLLGVVRRTQVPDDPDKAMRGGFCAGMTPSGNPQWRSPASPSALPLLPSLLSLCRAVHCLCASPPPQHPALFSLPAQEHRVLVGVPKEVDLTDNGHTVQTFLHTVHDNICLIIGAAASNLGREFYAVPGLCTALIESVLHNLPHLPDHWLRPIVRNALRPLIHHCPPNHYHDIAIPILDHFAPFMLSHLSARWEYISGLYESGALEEGATHAQEVEEDMLVRHLSREYIELIKICIVGGPLVAEGVNEMEEEPSSGLVGSRAPECVSELGAMVLSHSPAGPALLHTVYGALVGPDSHTSLRATVIIPPAVRHLTQGGPSDGVEVCGALVSLLSALRPHGQHESNQAALLATALHVYETVRPLCPRARDVLAAIPDVDTHDVQRLDERLAATAANASADKPAKHDKGKRDLFKKITSKLIGRNVGQLFKKEVLIMNLPQIPVAPRDKPRGPLDTPGDPGIRGLFTQTHT